MPLPSFLFSGWLSFLGCLLLICPQIAQAQEDRPTGEIVIVVFDLNGLPVPGVRVRVGNIVAGTTDVEGVATLQVEPGDVSLSLQKDGLPSEQTPYFPVEAGRSLEILVTYTKETSSIIDIETPTGEGLAPQVEEKGSITGLILNDKGQPVSTAQIFVRGAPSKARSDEKGRFTLDEVPATTVDLTVIHPDYSSKTVADVVVQPNEVTKISVSMLPAAGASQTFIVSLPKLEGGTVFVLEERRDSSNVADLLGADQISKAGDSDAAAALSRVTGVTLVDGRFVYIRGLGERYTSAFLNGSTMPAPNPETRAIPLDLFPSSIIGSLVVQKTYSPNLPAEFGGGSINIRTREIPDDFFANVSLSAAYLSDTTFETGLGYEGTSTDWLGLGLSERLPPSSLRAVMDEGPIRENLTEFSQNLNNDFSASPQDIPPNFGVGASVGGSIDVGKRKIGLLGAINYGNSWFEEESDFRAFAFTLANGGQLNPLSNANVRLNRITQNSVNLAGLVLGSLTLSKNHKIDLTASISRISENNTALQYGRTGSENETINSIRLQWIELQLMTAQLRGKHTHLFNTNLQFNWRYMLSYATRDEPDRRDTTYRGVRSTVQRLWLGPQQTFLSPMQFEIDIQADRNQRLFSALEDINHDLNFDISLPVNIFGDVESTFTAGAAIIAKTRFVEARRFEYRIQPASGRDEQILRIRPRDTIFADDLLQPDDTGLPVFALLEISRDDDTVNANQEIYAGFFQGNIGITDRIAVMTGVRVEQSSQQIETRPAPNAELNDEADLSTFDILPALTITWEFIENMQLRAAASRTISRPNFRELSPSVTIALGGAYQTLGNPGLQRTLITNLDVRYEWYPSPGESFSISGFYKAFDKPIEPEASTGAGLQFRPRNIPEAINIGGEIDSRIEFGFLGDFFSDFYFAGNFTLVHSEVSIPEASLNNGISAQGLTNGDRPLAFQSPWVVNGQLGYDNPASGISLAVLYNVFGPRIVTVGVGGRQDFYEQSFDRLNFVASWKVNRYKLQLKATNLLNPVQRITEQSVADDIEYNRTSFRRGRQFSVGVGIDLN